jgi:hypothetical protein
MNKTEGKRTPTRQTLWNWKNGKGLPSTINLEILNGTDNKVVDSITAIINKGTYSYQNRVNHFNQIKKFI